MPAGRFLAGSAWSISGSSTGNPAHAAGRGTQHIGRRVFLTSGDEVSGRLCDFLIAVLYSLYLLGFHPAREVSVDLRQGFARLLRDGFGGKAWGKVVEDRAPIEAGPLGGSASSM